jgi:protein-tyrosine-phosphatase
MSAPKHVLFVCTGNTCRSPMAEALFRKATAGRDDYTVSSAGVSASKGTPANPDTIAILKKRNAPLTGFGSRQVSKKILEDATHVFAMTRSHLRTLELQFPAFSEKYHLVGEYANLPKGGIGHDVPDPIGMGRAAYEETANVLEIAVPTIIAYIDQTYK